jgi:hypothetical protein
VSAVIPSYDMPPVERDGDFLRDRSGNLYASLGDDNDDGTEFFRCLSDDEAHDVWVSELTDYDRRADYADRECVA